MDGIKTGIVSTTNAAATAIEREIAKAAAAQSQNGQLGRVGSAATEGVEAVYITVGKDRTVYSARTGETAGFGSSARVPLSGASEDVKVAALSALAARQDLLSALAGALATEASQPGAAGANVLMAALQEVIQVQSRLGNVASIVANIPDPQTRAAQIIRSIRG